MATTRVSRSETYPVPLRRAFDDVLTAPLQQIFSRRYAAIPAITALEDQVGEWGRVGQTRTVVMSDGARMEETLTEVDRPHAFGYRIVPVDGPLRLLVAHADGRWTFEPAGSAGSDSPAATTITWAWEITPRHALAGAAMPVLARLWQGYARQGLAQLGILLA